MKKIAITGTLGVGKTTLLKFIREKYHNNKKIFYIDEAFHENATVQRARGVAGRLGKTYDILILKMLEEYNTNYLSRQFKGLHEQYKKILNIHY